jgi:hypothetical protein
MRQIPFCGEFEPTNGAKKMRTRMIFSIVGVLACAVSPGYAGFYDSVTEMIARPSEEGPGDSTLISGLKEALSIGTEDAVKSVSKVDGYLGNQAIKILLPEKIQKTGDILSKLGYEDKVDAFILSMNRAAEKAAPRAVSFFVDAIKEMTFDDAKGILQGGDTAATEFFESKTRGKLYDAFKPIVSSSMDEVKVTQAYKEMMGKYTSAVPFASTPSLDLDHYVTTKSLDGLFTMVGQEEKKIRTDPAARVTDLLKETFQN